jgi:hypothetical protein
MNEKICLDSATGNPAITCVVWLFQEFKLKVFYVRLNAVNKNINIFTFEFIICDYTCRV